MHSIPLAFAGFLGASALFADSPQPDAQPVIVDGRIQYPEGLALPRHESDLEQRLRRDWPDFGLRGSTPPPDGPVRCVAEYEPMDGLLIAWEGSSGMLTVLQNMAVRITNEGAAKVYVVVDTVSEQTFANNALASAGANLARVQYIVRMTDSIWIRDYGPRYVYQGNCRAIVDHTYNRPARPNDDVLPQYFAQVKHHALYEIPLIHGGGNYHLNALGEGHATRLVINENPGLTPTQIHDLWQNYQNVDTLFETPFPTSVDSTQHIDMWMQIIGDHTVMISDWPNNVASAQDLICDGAAMTMQAAGWTVHRVVARSLGGTHYTYTNVVMCNGIVLLPTYTQANIVADGNNDDALVAWQNALPSHQIIQIGCQALVTSAGVMHCIVMHVPQHLGGQNPTAYLRNLRGGESLTPNDVAEIRWISDDDEAVANVDLLLSTNGGATWDTVLANQTADDGSFSWTVPNIATTQARIRVVTRDAAGRTGSDDSPADFSILGTAGLPGDLNCDSLVTVADIGPFVLALTDPSGYAAQYPGCSINNADINSDDLVTVADIGPFVALLTGG